MARSVDWEAARRDYESGGLSIREVAAKFSTSKSTVSRHIKDEGWAKDPTGEIKRKRRIKLAEIDANEQRRDTARDSVPQTTECPVSDSDAAVDRHINVIQSHRASAQDLRRLNSRSIELLDWWLNGDEKQQEEAAKRLFVARGDSLTAHLNAAASMLEKIVRIERDSYGLDDVDGDLTLSKAQRLKDEISSRLDSLARAGKA